MNKPPIFIIGSGRSGTNMLRDILTNIPGLITWPCDEINLIFRHGNIDNESDRFLSGHLNPQAESFIRNSFNQLQKKDSSARIIEKTCANSLRVPFLDALFPDAKYIFITRNGFDVIPSAMIRWKAPVELGYLWKKVKYVPVQDVPLYLVRFVSNRIKKVISKDGAVASWGPIYSGMKDDVINRSLVEVCAKQWKICMDTSEGDLSKLSSEKVFKINYDDFVNQPESELKELIEWMDRDLLNSVDFRSLVSGVRPSKAGNGIKKFSKEDLNLVENLISNTNKLYDL